jgi:hypothetical protein
MADTNTTSAAAEAPKKRRKAQGPRTAKPIFAVVTYQDESGNDVILAKTGLKIRLERDAATLLDLVTGEGMGSAAVVRCELPASATKPAAA